MKKQFYHIPKKQSNNNCTACARGSSVSSLFETIVGGQFSNTKSGDYNLVTTTPLFQPTLEGDVLVPLAQTLISGLLFVSVSIPVVMWVGFDWPLGLFFATNMSLVGWIRGIRNAAYSREKTEEMSFSQGTETTSQIARTQSENRVQLEVIHEVSGLRNHMQLLELPAQIGEDEFAGFLRDILAGKSLARDKWAGTGKPFSRGSYDGMMEQLLSASIIQTSVNNGKQLSNGGKHAIKRLELDGLI